MTRKIVDVIQIYENKQLHFTKRLEKELGITPPAELIFELNENNEVVVRENK